MPSGAWWTAREERLLAERAPFGIDACKLSLPDRSRSAIWCRARRAGIRIRHDGGGGDRHWRGAIPIPPGCHPIVRILYEAMNRQQASITDVAERAGVGYHTIRDWRRRNDPRLSDLVAALNVLDLTLAVQRVRQPAEAAA